MKQNDWIVANINNPNFTTGDFLDTGLSVDNTLMLSELDYLNSKFITENPNFQDDAGMFSKNKFDTFYKQSLAKFNDFTSLSTKDNFKYDIFNARYTPNSKVKDYNFTMQIVPNPDHTGFGTGARGEIGTPNMSPMELAETLKIFDVSTLKFMDVSPNDKSLLSSPIKFIKLIFSSPLVMAQWEDDSYHIDPLTGEKKKHKKGEYKLNSEGQYYTETLNGRNPMNKRVISLGNLLTIDGTPVNKYDFFDSDDIQKSTEGIIAKTAAAVVPLFIPYVDIAYGGLLATREILKTAPMLYGMLSSLFDPETIESKTANSILGFATQISGDVSDYSKQSNFTFENIANMVTDVALQWGQLAAIVKGINQIKGGSTKMLAEAELKAKNLYDKKVQELTDIGDIENYGDVMAERVGVAGMTWKDTSIGQSALRKYMPEVTDAIEKQQILGLDLSLVYMAAISNTDVYNDLLNHGASKREAALVSLGSSVGMFSVDRYLGLGKMFFDEANQPLKNSMRGIFHQSTKDWKNNFLDQYIGKGLENSKEGMSKLLKAGMDLGKGSVNTFIDGMRNHSLGFFSKAFGEGLEEVTEEVVTDMTKEMYLIAGQLGVNTSTKNVGAFNNGDINAMAQRYFMNFLGGFMGGGIFYTTGKFKNAKINNKTDLNEMIYLIRQGYGDKLRAQAKAWHDDGKFGSTSLSALNTETDENGNKVRITAKDGELTENDYVYNKLLEEINQVNTILNTYGTDKSDDELFDQMILSDIKFRKLANYLKDTSYTTKYLELYLDLSSKLVKITKDIELANATKTGTIPVDDEGNIINNIADISEDLRYLDKYRENKGEGYLELNNTRNANLKKLTDIKMAILNEILAYHDGAKSMPYTDMLLFSMDDKLNGPYVQMNFKSWLSTNYHQDPLDLPEAELISRQEQYRNYKKLLQPLDLKEQFNIYSQLRTQLTPFLSEVQQQVKDMSGLSTSLNNFFSNRNWLGEGMKGEKDRLDLETDEEFNNPQAHKNKLLEYNYSVFEANIKKLQDIIDSHPGQYVDPITARFIHREIGRRSQDMINLQLLDEQNRMSILDSKDLIGGRANAITELVHIMRNLNENATNALEVKLDIETILESKKYGMNQVYLDPLYDVATRMILNANPGLEYDDIVQNPEYGFTKFLNSDNQIDTRKFIEDIIGHRIDSTEGDIAHDFRDSLYEFKDYIENNIEKFETLDMSKDEILNKINTIVKSATQFDSFEAYENTLKDAIDNLKAQSFAAIDRTVSELSKSAAFNLLQSVRVTKENPILPLIRNLALYTHKNARNIEELCERLDAQFQKGESPEGFILEDVDNNDIQDALLLLRMAKSFVYGASTIDNFKNPIGHNIMLNEFAKRNHVQNFEPLPQIDANMAALLYLELDKYINELDPNSFNSWSYKSTLNESNKLAQFENAKNRFAEVKQNFWKLNQDAFKLLDGTDLLEGYNSNMSVNDIENLFYDNVHSYLASGHTVYDLLQTGFLKKVIQEETLYKLKSTRLDDRLEYANFTSNDKLVYLMTSMNLRSDTFNKFLLSKVKENNNIVPLDIQEYLAKVAIAFIQGDSAYNDLFRYLEEEHIIDLPMFKNVLFVSGVGGAGKTMVVASYIKDFFLDSTIWVGAPASTLTTKLGNNLTITYTFTKQDILNMIIALEKYLELKNDFDEAKGNPSDMTNMAKAVDDTEVNTTENAPKIFIIDEITHFSTLDLALLNKWATVNNVRIVTLGDESQNGYSDKNKVVNIDTDNCFVIRTPKLFLSLRSSNVLQVKNLKNLSTIIDSLLENIADVDSLALAARNAIALLRGFNLHVYNQDTLSGDLLTNALDMSLIGKIKGETVGYLGDTSSDTFKMLKDNGINPIVFNSEQDLQGQEVGYMILDPKFGFWSEYNNIFQNANIGLVTEFLRKVYTVISRGQSGTIIIDKGNELTKLIGSNVNDSLTSKVKSLSEVAKKFRENRRNELEGMKFTDEPDFTPISKEPKANTIASQEDINVDEQGKSKLDKEDEMSDQQIILSRKASIDSPEVIINPIQSECRVYTQSIDGVEHDENGNWILGTNNNDINIIVPLGTTSATTGSDKHFLFDTFNKFKKDLLYRMNDFDNLNKSTKNIFLLTNALGIEDGGRYAWENAKFYVEIRPKNETDHLVGLSDLSNDKLADSNNLVYTVIMEFTRFDRQQCKLTLGLLPNIDTYSNYINNNEVSEDLKLNFLLYQKLVKAGATKFEIERPKESAITYLIRESTQTPILAIRNITKDSEGNELPKELLLRSSDSDTNVISFKERGRYLIFSKPYVYMGGLDDVEYGLSQNCRGMLALFVSDDPYMSQDALLQTYLQEKEDEIKNDSFGDRRVRLMPLNPRGLSFSDLINPLFKDIITTNYGTASTKAISHFPFDVARMGLKMYATLWNTRANLIQFITNSVDTVPSQFDGVLNLYEDLAFINYAKLQLLNANINQFNAELLANKQEQFRLTNQGDYYIKWDDTQARSLGYTELMSDQEVLKFISDNHLSNYIHLSADRAVQMLDLLNNIINLFNPIIKISDSEGNNYSPIHSIDPTIPEGTELVSNNSISNLLKSNSDYSEGSLTIHTVDGDDATFTYNFDVVNKNSVDIKNKYAGFKLVPLILVKAAKIVSLENAGKNISKNQITLYNLDKTNHLDIDLSPLLSSVGTTNDFLNNMSLIFHGTSSPVHNENSFRATIAPFKYGFRTYPILFMEEKNTTKDKPFRKAATSDALFFTNVAVTSLFNIKITPKQVAPSINVPNVLLEVKVVLDVVNQLDDKESYINCKTLEDVNKVVAEKLNDELLQDSVNIYNKVLGVTKEGKIIKSISINYDILDNNNYRFEVGENKYVIFDGKQLSEVEEDPLVKMYDSILSKLSNESLEKLKGLDMKLAIDMLVTMEGPDIDSQIDDLFYLASKLNNKNTCF